MYVVILSGKIPAYMINIQIKCYTNWQYCEMALFLYLFHYPIRQFLEMIKSFKFKRQHHKQIH